MIFIQGNTPSSKNSKQFVTLKNGKTMLLNSKTVQNYIKKSKVDWIKNKTEFLKMLKGLIKLSYFLSEIQEEDLIISMLHK